MEKRWNIVETAPDEIQELQLSLKVSSVICRILIQRGIKTFQQAKNYFRPELSQLHSPWLMKDMHAAVARIGQAVKAAEKILVFGDYDVDGTTAVACMFRFLQNIHPVSLMDFYIPHRYREGYGVSEAGINFAAENGFSLIIALDCGIKSVELIGYAKDLGIDFIVCDHHLPEKRLPPAAAILNPKQPGCTYPYKELCGCGVGLKLMMALTEHFHLEENAWQEWLDLLATAIAADIVPMDGENRVFAFYGMKKVNENPSHGIRALIELSGMKKGPVNITNLVFMIAPRVNAAGRMDDARKAVLMFIEKDYQTAFAYAGMLHDHNTDRKEADSSITEEALALIETEAGPADKYSTVVFQAHWHKGVVGIVASRLIEKYYRPTIVLTKSGEFISGSARSVAGFNLYEAIHACREYLLGYGGHFAAAGLTMLPASLEAFREKFETVVAETLSPELRSPELNINAIIRFGEINQTLYRIICQMEPFGPENMRPVFLSTAVMDRGWSKIVKESHVKFSLQQDGVMLDGIGFGLAHKFALVQSGQPLDIVFTIDENEWNGNKTLQLKIIDLRLSHTRPGQN